MAFDVGKRIWLYYTLQTVVAAFISIWPNFGLAYAMFQAGNTDPNQPGYKLWDFPTPLHGDMLVTIGIQTALTTLISGFLVSVDLEKNASWLFGVELCSYEIDSRFAFLYSYVRPFKWHDRIDGCRGFGRGIVRIGLHSLLWVVLLGIPLSITLLAAFWDYTFTGMQCAFAKGAWGAIISLIQVPFIVYMGLVDDKRQPNEIDDDDFDDSVREAFESDDDVEANLSESESS